MSDINQKPRLSCITPPPQTAALKHIRACIKSLPFEPVGHATVFFGANPNQWYANYCLETDKMPYVSAVDVGEHAKRRLEYVMQRGIPNG